VRSDITANLCSAKTPCAAAALWQECIAASTSKVGGTDRAISAIDIRFIDIAGKGLGRARVSAAGGKQRDFVPCIATTPATDGPRLLEDVQLLLSAAGASSAPPPGHPDRDGDETLSNRASDRPDGRVADSTARGGWAGTGPGIDYHHRLSVAEAASFCQRMPRGTLDFLEEPIRAESPEAYAAAQ